MKPAIVLTFLLLCFAGCTFARKSRQTTVEGLAANASSLTEHSKALTTAGVDVLTLAPFSPHVTLALDFARRDQQIEGLPLPRNRIDVPALLTNGPAAVAAYATQIKGIDILLSRQAELEAELRAKEGRLIEMGAKYEAEKNKNIVARVWHWSLGTLGIGGIIALMFFFPFLIPIFGRLVATLVSWFPKIAGFAGVVGTKAFDAVVKGVEHAKEGLGKEKVEVLHTELSKSTDEAHKAIIDARQRAVT